MIDQNRVELILSTAQSMGLKPKLLTDYGLISLQIDGKEHYIFYDASNTGTQISTGLTKNKHASRVMFERNGLPNIPFCLTDNLDKACQFLAEHKKIIVKPVKGQHSQDIHLIETAKELENFNLPNYILEKYIEGRELRYLVYNDQVIAVHLKDYETAINDPETVKRISFEKDRWNDHLTELAIKAARVFGLKLTAVDFKVTSSGEVFLLEINSAPGIDRFQNPDTGPGIDLARIFLNEVIKNYRS